MKIFLSILSLILLKGIFVGFFVGANLLLGNSEIFTSLLIGFTSSGLAYYFILRKISAIATFEHEFTHALVALLFFRKISKFVVTNNDGGYVGYSGNFGGKFGSINITLAPYFLPTFTFILILFRPVMPIDMINWFDILIGFSFGYHLFTTFEEIKINWTNNSFLAAKSERLTKSDISKSGYIFSFIYIITLTTLIHGIIIWIWVDNYDGILKYFIIIYTNSKELITQSVVFATKYIRSF